MIDLNENLSFRRIKNAIRVFLKILQRHVHLFELVPLSVRVSHQEDHILVQLVQDLRYEEVALSEQETVALGHQDVLGGFEKVI